MAATLPRQEPYIEADALRLYYEFVGKDLEHNAHGIFTLAGEAVKRLISRYDCHPYAIELTVRLVRHFLAAYRTANGTAPELDLI